MISNSFGLSAEEGDTRTYLRSRAESFPSEGPAEGPPGWPAVDTAEADTDGGGPTREAEVVPETDTVTAPEAEGGATTAWGGASRGC